MRKFLTSIPLFIFTTVLVFLQVFAQAQDDAGISAITQPTGTVCRGNVAVEATLHNFSAVNITTCTVQWEVNGVPQAPFAYSGTLLPGGDETVSLGNYSFNGGAYTIVAYSENPNGNTDVDNSNDTSSSVVNTQMSGTYTLGGTTPDYTTFTAAVSDLNTIGVCGPVTFNVRPGTYTEKLVINQITGASSTNTITFQSENGDSSTTILTTPSIDSTSAGNYLIRLDGADYLTFRQLTLARSGISSYARIIDYANVASNNSITNCHMISVVNLIANSFCSIIYSGTGTPANDSINSFTNNLFENGSIGIYFNGVASQNLEAGTVLTGNVFLNQVARGIQISNQLSPVITDNIITSNTTTPGFFGIYLNVCQRNLVVSKNKISGISGNGIYMIDCTAYPVPHSVISNNFVHTTDSSGITSINGYNQDIVFNSVHCAGPTASNSAVAVRGNNNNMIVSNNALVNSGGGFAYLIADSAFDGISSSDYNDLYTTGANVGNYRGINQATLADWQTAFGRDTNSISIDPAYVSSTDLHATAASFNDLGSPLANVTVDIDNQARSATTPDIGADEFAAQAHDVGVVALLSPTDNECESATTTVKVVIRNFGAFPETNVPVEVVISGAFTDVLTQTDANTIAPGADDTLTFVATTNTTGGGVAVFKAYTQAAIDDNHSNDTLASNVTINATPAPPVPTGAEICGPGQVVLTATSTDTLIWYDVMTGGTPIDTGSPFTTPFISTTTTFYVEARNVCGSARVAVDAVILPLPAVSLGNDTTLLLGSSITLDAGAGFLSYLWAPGNETTQTITVSPIVPTCYTVTVIGANGCINSDTLCIDVVFPADVGVMTLITPTDHQCENAVTPITLMIKNYGSTTATDVPVRVDISGPVTVTFLDTLFGSIPAGGSLPITLDSTINTTGGGVFTFTSFTIFANDQLSSNDSLISIININIVPNPPTVTDVSRCGPGPVTLTGTATDTIYWYDAATGGSLLAIGTYNIPFLAVTTTYYAQTGSSFTCPSATRSALTVTILALPPVSLGIDILIECYQDTTLDAGAGYISYAWSTGETTQTIMVDTTGDFIVTVTDTSGCSNSDTIHVDCFVGGIYQGVVSDLVKVYPNPSSGMIYVDFKTPLTVAIKWTDIQGRLIAEENLKGVRQYQVDLSSVSKGIYVMQLITNNEVTNYRVVIE